MALLRVNILNNATRLLLMVATVVTQLQTRYSVHRSNTTTNTLQRTP